MKLLKLARNYEYKQAGKGSKNLAGLTKELIN
jgi:hypothetical protein